LSVHHGWISRYVQSTSTASSAATPRISQHYHDNVSVTNQTYFAITPKACICGGRLEVALSNGLLYAYFWAYADCLIKYKPFHCMTDGCVAVCIQYNLDLWLVSLSIPIELSASLHIDGPP